MKFRYYLRGAGVGIIVSTVILMIAFSRYKPKMSADEIIKEAKKLGMVMSEYNDGYVKDDDTTNDETTDDDDKTQDDSGEDQNQNESTDNQDGNDDSTQDPDGENTDQGNNDSTNDNNSGNTTERTYVTLVISSGDTSEIVSQKLLSIGVITDKDEFNRWLCLTKGLGSNIICGTFEIPTDATYDEIAEIITN